MRLILHTWRVCLTRLMQIQSLPRYAPGGCISFCIHRDDARRLRYHKSVPEWEDPGARTRIYLWDSDVRVKNSTSMSLWTDRLVFVAIPNHSHVLSNLDQTNTKRWCMLARLLKGSMQGRLHVQDSKSP